jgi:hypothetical protein
MMAKMPESAAQQNKVIKSVIKALGAPLFCYSLDLQESSVADLLEGRSGPPAGKEKIFLDFMRRITRAMVDSTLSGVSPKLNLPSLRVIQSGEVVSLYNYFRQESGAALPSFELDDPVLKALAPLATDVFPMVLSGPYSDRLAGYASIKPVIAGHAAENFERVALEDSALCRLFPNPTADRYSISNTILSNTGSGGGVQLVSLASLILNASYVLMRMRNQLGSSEFKAAIVEVVAMIRSAATGEPTQVPAWLAIGNVSVPRRIALPRGTISPYPLPSDLELIPQEARPSVVGDDSTPLGAIIETSYLYTIRIYEPRAFDDDMSWPSNMDEQRKELASTLTAASLALTLAVERKPLVAPTTLWTVVFSPLSWGPSIHWNPNRSSPLPHIILTHQEAAQVEKWGALLSDSTTAATRIAIRRLLSAISGREDPVDGFVDAIVAWESLFAGTSQGELSFRICAAMSKLLTDSLNDRTAIHKSLISLYRARSAVVHGSKELDTNSAIAYRDDALDALVKCLRRLYQDFPDLVVDPDRSRSIILGM